MYDITQHPFFKRGIAVLVLAQSVLLSVKVKGHVHFLCGLHKNEKLYKFEKFFKDLLETKRFIYFIWKFRNFNRTTTLISPFDV